MITANTQNEKLVYKILLGHKPWYWFWIAGIVTGLFLGLTIGR